MQGDSPAGPSSPPSGFAIGTGRLAKIISRIWRVFWTGISFAHVGVVCLLLGLVVFPIIRLGPGTREEKDIRSQRWVHRAVRNFFLILEFLRLGRLRCNDAERLRRPGLLVVANHPTLIDAFCLIALMPQADCVVKASHFQNPFLAAAAKGAGYISNLNGPLLVADCVERLQRGRSVIVFPEGTRSALNSLGPFARGAAHVAMKAGCNPLPVTIQCEPATLSRGKAWWDVPERKFTLALTVDEPLVVKDILQQPMPTPRAARVLTSALEDHFERRLNIV